MSSRRRTLLHVGQHPSDTSEIHLNSENLCSLRFRLKNSNQLETSLQNGKTLLSGYENKLAREEVAPADISSLEKTQRELGVGNSCTLFQSVQ